MRKITTAIHHSSLSDSRKEDLLQIIEDADSLACLKPDKVIIDIAKKFLAKEDSWLEVSNVIPEVMMRKQGKMLDFIINSHIYGKVFVVFIGMAFILVWAWSCTNFIIGIIWLAFVLFIDYLILRRMF